MYILKSISKEIEVCRVTTGPLSSDSSYGNNGAFDFGQIHVVISDGKGWDHVSVSCHDRCPNGRKCVE